MENPNRDIELLKLLKDGEQKQYHFFIFIALGVLSFSIERFDIGKDQHWLTIVQLSWLSLLVSSLAGIIQVQWRLAVDGTQRLMISVKKDLSVCIEALAGKAIVLDDDATTKLSIEKLRERKTHYEKVIDVGEKDFKKRSKQLLFTTQVQVISLYLGLLLLALFKILNTAYR